MRIVNPAGQGDNAVSGLCATTFSRKEFIFSWLLLLVKVVKSAFELIYTFSLNDLLRQGVLRRGNTVRKEFFSLWIRSWKGDSPICAAVKIYCPFWILVNNVNIWIKLENTTVLHFSYVLRLSFTNHSLKLRFFNCLASFVTLLWTRSSARMSFLRYMATMLVLRIPSEDE